jgi:integrase
MASITRESNGRKTIQFIGTDKKRRSLRLGKASLEYARTIKNHVESIMAAKRKAVSISAETADWLGKVDDEFHEQLDGVGLVELRVKAKAEPGRTLEILIAAYNADRLKAKPGTRTAWGQTQRNLIDKLGRNKLITGITVADAENWAEWLAVDQKLGKVTCRRRCGHAKQFFQFAVKSRWLVENPFAGLDSMSRPNRSRDCFVSRETAGKVIDACPDHEWRLLFALSRYGGLRCPSEHLALKWTDIDWARARMNVRSPKTEHHEGHEARTVPIFPELAPFLQAAWDRAPEGAEFVITRYRATAGLNLRTQLLRIIAKAGVPAWPKLWNNLRATRETELEESFPSHVVCAWFGNSRKVAREHYLQVTETHFAKAVQNPVHPPGTQAHAVPPDDGTGNENGHNVRGHVAKRANACGDLVVVAGFEPATPSM